MKGRICSCWKKKEVKSLENCECKLIFYKSFTIFNAVVKLSIQQIFNHFLNGSTRVKRNAICLYIPICCPPIFFLGKSLRTYIQSLVFPGICLIKLEYIEPDTQLSSKVSLNHDIAFFPLDFLCLHMLVEPKLVSVLFWCFYQI